MPKGFKTVIGVKEEEINSAKPTAMEYSIETQRKRDIYTFNCSIRINFHSACGGRPFSNINV